jgi:quercetin dioxygenase-like cupin family protein
LDVPVSRLIEQETASPTVVTRKADLKKVTDKRGISREHLGAVVTGSRVEFIRYTLPARGVAGCFAPHRAGTIERVFLLNGRVKVTVGEERHELSAGDAIVYRADTNHGFTNLGSTVAVIHLIIEQGK